MWLQPPNLISLLAALIVMGGWYVTAVFNRRKDIAQKRTDLRLKALEAVLDVWFGIQASGGNPWADPRFLDLLANARSKVGLYGFQDEIVVMEAFISSIEQKKLLEANAGLQRLVDLTRNRIREELQLPAVEMSAP
jgi:hypothetical protein